MAKMQPGELFEEDLRQQAQTQAQACGTYRVLPKEAIPRDTDHQLTDNDIVIQATDSRKSRSVFFCIQASLQQPDQTTWQVDHEKEHPLTRIFGEFNRPLQMTRVGVIHIPGLPIPKQHTEITTRYKYTGKSKDFLADKSNDFLKAAQTGAYYARTYIDQHKHDRRPPMTFAYPIVVTQQPTDGEIELIGMPQIPEIFDALAFQKMNFSHDQGNNLLSCIHLNEKTFPKFLEKFVTPLSQDLPIFPTPE